jgi:hypothetical protein
MEHWVLTLDAKRETRIPQYIFKSSQSAILIQELDSTYVSYHISSGVYLTSNIDLMPRF